jgi:hypothetical protein
MSAFMRKQTYLVGFEVFTAVSSTKMAVFFIADDGGSKDL